MPSNLFMVTHIYSKSTMQCKSKSPHLLLYRRVHRMAACSAPDMVSTYICVNMDALCCERAQRHHRWTRARSHTSGLVTTCFDLEVASVHILMFSARAIVKEASYFKIALQIKLCTIRNACLLFGRG